MDSNDTDESKLPPDPYSHLSSNERREEIAKRVHQYATEPYYINTKKARPKSGVPLFERSGIKNSPELQKEILRLTTEYVDMLLVQDTIRRYHPEPEVEQKRTADAEDQKKPMTLQTLAKKEIVMWGVRALEISNRFKPAIIQYGCWQTTEPSKDVRSKETLLEKGQLRFIHSIIALALLTKEKINCIKMELNDIPSVLSSDMISIYYEHTKLGSPERTLAQTIVGEQLQQLREADSKGRSK